MSFDRVQTVDYHTGGEPFRIVAAPPVEIRGRNVAERRIFAMGDAGVDRLRRVLCHEPRGHADMYGGFIVPPDDDGARLGVLFCHKDGFSTACGHGTIALGVWAVRSGLVAAPTDGTVDVPIDVRSVGLAVTPADLPALISLGREVKAALADHPAARHPTDERLSGIYGTIFFEAVDGPVHQRNVTVFADGEVDRSPCGSGTAARVATLAAAGALKPGQTLTHDSIVGSRFMARYETGPGIVPVITGMAYPTGEHTFVVDPDDPMTPGFVLR
jgi:proline racemase/trans-L-3-hydroxyproline dehydratase